MYGIASEVREGGELVIVIRRRHGHDIRRSVVSWEERRGVIVAAIVAGGRDEEHVIAVRRIYRVEQRLREASAAPTVGEDADVGGASESLFGLNCELDTLNGVGRVPAAC